MDECASRFVDGGFERFPNLASVLHRSRVWCLAFWRVHSAHVRNLSAHLLGNRGAGHEWIEIGCGPSSAETDANRAHGAIAKSTSKVFDIV